MTRVKRKLTEWEITGNEKELSMFVEALNARKGELISSNLLLKGEKDPETCGVGMILSVIMSIMILSVEGPVWTSRGDYFEAAFLVRLKNGDNYCLNSRDFSSRFKRVLRGYGLDERFLFPD